MVGTLFFFTQMHKKAFGDWAYSAPPYLAGLKSGREGKGREAWEETRGGGGKIRLIVIITVIMLCS